MSVQADASNEVKEATERSGLALVRDCSIAWWRGEEMPPGALMTFGEFRERLRAWWRGEEPDGPPPAATTAPRDGSYARAEPARGVGPATWRCAHDCPFHSHTSLV